MNIQKLYETIKTGYPLVYDQYDGDCLDFITEKIERYVKQASALSPDELKLLNGAFDKLPEQNKPSKSFDFLRDLSAIKTFVLDVLNDSFRSYHEDAFEKVISFFHADTNFYLGMLPECHVHNTSLIRLRKGYFKDAGDGALFHVPFEMRHLVGSQRYSIPGYSALYLAGSFFTAWCELDCPNLSNLSYAKFRFKEKRVFLDLGLPYREPLQLWELYSLFAMYPLLMACMVRVKHPEAPFKPEYLMPQLMLKLVREHSRYYAGITYMSNKLPASFNPYSLASRNFVVCTFNSLCRYGWDTNLAESMEMTDICSLTQQEVKNATACDNGLYTINFKELAKCVTAFRDIHVNADNCVMQ